MLKINCLVVDDEAPARRGLVRYVEQLDFMDNLASVANAVQAREYLNQGGVDLLWLDINMPGLKGTDFLRTLIDPPKVIFTTAYSEYALESFEFDVIDYLVKPISFERFLQAANKALKRFSEAKAIIDKTDKESFYIKDGRQLVRISIHELRYVESADNYVRFFTDTGNYMSLMTIRELEELLPADRFLRINRSCVIAKDRIESIDGNEVKIGADRLVISRRMKGEVMRSLLG
ncbi:MAG: LytTR family DNA-binding domain-containing protein [Bacteroidota bacterium]